MKLKMHRDRRTNVYIAAPYRGTAEEIEARMSLVSKVFSILRSFGHFVTSPMLHHYTFNSEHDASDGTYWLAYSKHVIESFSYNNNPELPFEVWLLDLPGWQESSGVRCELETAWKCGITVRLFKNFGDDELTEVTTIEPHSIPLWN